MAEPRDEKPSFVHQARAIVRSWEAENPRAASNARLVGMISLPAWVVFLLFVLPAIQQWDAGVSPETPPGLVESVSEPESAAGPVEVPAPAAGLGSIPRPSSVPSSPSVRAADAAEATQKAAVPLEVVDPGTRDASPPEGTVGFEIREALAGEYLAIHARDRPQRDRERSRFLAALKRAEASEDVKRAATSLADQAAGWTRAVADLALAPNSHIDSWFLPRLKSVTRDHLSGDPLTVRQLAPAQRNHPLLLVVRNHIAWAKKLTLDNP